MKRGKRGKRREEGKKVKVNLVRGTVEGSAEEIATPVILVET